MATGVASLRTHRKIPCFVPKEDVAAGELMNIKQAAAHLGAVPSS
jgi:hypothetical protein